MTTSLKSNKYLSYIMLIIGVISTRLPFLNFIVFVAIFVAYLYFIYTNTNFNKTSYFIPIKIYSVYIIAQIIRSILISDNYWAFKAVFSTSICLAYIMLLFYFDHPIKLLVLYRKWFKYCLWLLFIFMPFMGVSSWGIYLAPILLLLLSFKHLNRRWRIIVIIFTIISISDFSARSVLLKFSFALLLALSYSVLPRIKTMYINILALLLFLTPIILFTLAGLGIFNIFNLEQYTNKDYSQKKVIDGQIVEENLLADTRTFMYTSVIDNMFSEKQIVFGKGPGYGVVFGDWEDLGGVGRNKNEIGALNLFMWTGIIGLMLWAFIIFNAVRLALNKSNNYTLKIFGLYLAFRWIIFWVEDIQDYYIDTIVLYTIIAICYSERFRQLTDREFKFWIYKLLK